MSTTLDPSQSGASESIAPKENQAPSTPTASPVRYRSMDAWRGIAALLVVVCHSVTPLLTDKTLQLDRFWFYRACAAGQLGVQIFFVISGFCIAALAMRLADKPNGALEFAKDRIRRIYPPYLIASVLAIGISVLAQQLVKHHILASSSQAQSPGLHESLQFYLASVLLLQVPLHYDRILPVSWTLCYEVAFYLMFAILLLFGRRIKNYMLDAMSALTIVALVVDIAFHVHNSAFPLDLLPQFGFGVLVYRILAEGKTPKVLIFSAVTTVLMVAYGITVNAHLDALRTTTRVQSFVTIGFAALLIALYNKDSRMVQTKAVQWLGWVGTFSYTLYLTHDFSRGFIMQIGRKLHISAHAYWIEIIVQLIVATIAARLLYAVIERPFLSKTRRRVSDAEQAAINPLEHAVTR